MLKLNRLRIIFYVLLIGWMALIFYMSAQSAQQSSNVSGGIVSKLIAVFLNKFDSLSPEEQYSITNTITFIVRKTAHFLEYFVLGILSVLSVFCHQKYEAKAKAFCSFVICVLYAISDEIHQFFVPGRACRITDVCIDAAGSATAIAIVATIIFFRKRRKSGELNAKKETD